MKFSPVYLSIFLLFFGFIPGFAQDVKDAKEIKSREQIELEEKTYKLLSEAASEAAFLKLPENRAFVYGAIGNLLWEKDEKNARRLFEDAVGELIEAQNNPKKRLQFGNGNFNYWTYVHNLLRQSVVYQILPKESDLALKTFYATRPAEVESAVGFYRQIAEQTGKNPDLSSYKQEEREKLDRASLEIFIEQNLKKEIGKNDPKKLAESIREAIDGGTNFQSILGDLETLNKKDHDAAQKLLSEFVEKLFDGDYLVYVKGYTAYLLYNKFLSAKNKSSAQTADGKSKELEFDEKKIKAIANREFDKLLTSDFTASEFNFAENAMYLKRILPERFAEIKPKIEKLKTAKELIDNMLVEEKIGTNPTIEQIVENSKDLYSSSRNNYYNSAIRKLYETETKENIEQKLRKIPDEKDRENAMSYLNSLAAGNNKAENAENGRQAALQIKNDKEKIAALVSLAISFHQKNTAENQKIAEDLMNEALGFVNQQPETETEFEKNLIVITGYASVKPDKAFEMSSPIIEKSNEIINAYVVMRNYNDKNYPDVGEGEIVFAGQDGYGSFSSKYREIAKKLAARDFERVTSLIKMFQRGDVRIAAKLTLAQSILAR